MSKLQIGDKVKVELQEYASDGEGVDEYIHGATGVVIEINNFVFPYVVKLDDERLSRLISDTPRQFCESELVKQ